MMFKVILLALFVVVMAADKTVEQQWEIYKKEHHKNFGAEEDNFRFKIFKDNLEKIEAHNKLYEEGKSSYKLGMNEFMDLTDEEFQRLNGLIHP